MRYEKAEALKDVNLFVLDMDGTVYLSDDLIEGSLDFVYKVRELGKDFVFFTNNASKVPAAYVEKLAGMGLTVEPNDVMTAGDVTAEYIKTYYPGKRVYLNGTKLLMEDFRAKGIQLVEEDPDVAVQSFDFDMDYDRMEKICRFVRGGVPFLATHPDFNCPTADGFIPDCGAMCALITASTGVEPRYLGKPQAETLEMVLKIKGAAKEEVAFVGDRIYTDVATGVNNGARGFLVLTGEADMQTVAESTVEPDCIFASLYEMSQYL